MGITQVSNINRFLQQLGIKTSTALESMGKAGVVNIKRNTPVDKGDLKKASYYKVERAKLWYINPLFYAALVELGTYRMNPNPFMKRGIKQSYPEFTNILIKGLRV